MEGIRELKSLALEAIEKKSSLLKNEKYIFLKIRNWKWLWSRFLRKITLKKT